MSLCDAVNKLRGQRVLFCLRLFAACFGQTWTHAAVSCAICIISTEIIVIGFQQLQDAYAHLMYPSSRHKTTTAARDVGR